MPLKPLQGLNELKRNLEKIQGWTDEGIVQGLELAGNNVLTHIKTKQEHKAGATLPKQTVKEHPDKMFYTWTSNLINSLFVSKVKFYTNGADIAIVSPGAQAPHNVAVEKGTTRSRAFPFLVPAVVATKQETVNFLVTSLRRSLRG